MSQELMQVCKNLFAASYQVPTVDKVADKAVLWAVTTEGHSFKISYKKGQYIVQLIPPGGQKVASTYKITSEKSRPSMPHSVIFTLKSAVPIPTKKYSLWVRSSQGHVQELMLFSHAHQAKQVISVALLCRQEVASEVTLPSQLIIQNRVNIRLFWQLVASKKLEHLQPNEPLYLAITSGSRPIACLLMGTVVFASAKDWSLLRRADMTLLRRQRKPVDFT